MTRSAPLSGLKRARRRGTGGLLRRLPGGALIGLGLVLAVVLFVAVMPLLPGYAPYRQNIIDGYLFPFTRSGANFYLLGTDPLGRDYLSRLALGARVSGMIGLGAVAISLVVGMTLGLIAGYFRGWAETLIMGLADIQLAIPRVLLVIAITAVIGPSALNLTLILGLTSWVAYGRVARAISLSLREREFVLAARTHGATAVWNIRKHLLPNVLPQIVIVASYELGQIIIIEASLSYLGLGIQPPLPSLGLMVADGQAYLQINPWLSILPGILLFMMVAGVQFLSQGFTAEGRDDGIGAR